VHKGSRKLDWHYFVLRKHCFLNGHAWNMQIKTKIPVIFFAKMKFCGVKRFTWAELLVLSTWPTHKPKRWFQSELWIRNSNFRLRLQLQASKFLAPAPTPTCKSFWLRFQIDLVNWKLKTIALFVQLACPTNIVCGTGTQFSGSSSGSGSTIQKCFDPSSAAATKN